VAKPPEIDAPGKDAVPSFGNRNDVPTVYFDIAPAYGVMSGIVQIEVGQRILIPLLTIQ
jgi:hypothetical protein